MIALILGRNYLVEFQAAIERLAPISYDTKIDAKCSSLGTIVRPGKIRESLGSYVARLAQGVRICSLIYQSHEFHLQSCENISILPSVYPDEVDDPNISFSAALNFVDETASVCTEGI